MWHALRRAYADRLLTLAQNHAVLINETAEPWHTMLTVTRSTLDGKTQAQQDLQVTVQPYDKTDLRLPDDLTRPDHPTTEVLWAEADGADRAWWFYAEDKDIAYPEAAYDTTTTHRAGDTRLTVTARTFLRDLTVYPDRLNPQAEVDDALRTLFPGEAVTFTIATATPLDEAKLTSKPVLRSVNDYSGTLR
jgi:beta-mannosidase